MRFNSTVIFITLSTPSFGSLAFDLPSMATPGSMWGDVRFPSSEQREDRDNLILEGAIEQGVDLFEIAEKTPVTAFVSLNYTLDSEKFDYNNKTKFGFGFKIRHFLTDSIVIDMGAKYELDHRLESNDDRDGFQGFTNWFGSWSPELLQYTDESGQSFPLSYPGFTWGGLRYPGSQDKDEEYDLILEGALEQGIDWVAVENVIFNTFFKLKYVVDNQDYAWNNSVTYGVGSKLKIPIANSGIVQFGVQFSQNKRLISGRTEDDVIFFLNWSFWWDPGVDILAI